MAQSTDSSVLALITSFTSGLDVFKKLKKRRKRKKEEKAALDETRLSSSLKKGPLDIHAEYSKNYALQGERFREGDIHASLTAVLLKLNNGLVSIISTFLSGGKKGGDLDYGRLTSLSETSRMEAIDALSQLSYRLSRSSLNLLKPSTKLDKAAKKKTDKKRDTRLDSKISIIRRVESANASAPQLAIIRPLNSQTSQSSRSTAPRYQAAPPTPAASPPLTPLYELPSNKSVPNLAYGQSSALPTPPPSPPQYSHHRPTTSHGRETKSPAQKASHKHTLSGGRDPLEEIRRRRMDKMTPSLYTFASDSTKLGEIPMHRWNQPFDYNEMAKLNAQAAANPTPPVHVKKAKKGLFSRFRRGNGDTV
ncbi:hypothetical protein BT63DRAFT_328245 [Microthyrium microscopicum]|uniref:Uncharacterized protein n=1 Tax=Microthyrium microscopicum TaxID=703497 RepID=A0A6A6U5Z2_9PEZI|nr:hypothetical protein BT63DRAFT_328245 [Microthyrium microscopicum]